MTHTSCTIIIALLFILSGLVVISTPVSAETSGDYTYTVSDAKTTITGYSGAGGAITIPSSLGGYAVVTIGFFAFASCTSLTSVTIPNSVTSIGDFAFESCTSLLSVTIPNSVTTIGNGAFSCCSDLTSLTIPNSVTTIVNYAFESCTSLTSVTIPDSVTYIGYGAFKSCTSMTTIDVSASNPNYASVDGVLYNKTISTLIEYPGGRTGSFTISDSVTSIGILAFSSCPITSVTIPGNVTTIGYGAFSECHSLTSVTIPGNVTTIGDAAFVSCISLTSMIIPDSITSIGYCTFAGCMFLTSVTIGNGVTTIGKFAFQSCTSLTSVTIPGNVTTIEDCAFYCCNSLTSINVDPSNVNYASVDGVLYNKAISTLIQCPGGKPGTFSIPGNVTTIGGYAFATCTNLLSISFLGLVAPTDVGENCFSGTDPGIRGHAYAASNFPAPGKVWKGLTMGEVTPGGPEPTSSTSDYTTLIVLAAVAVVVLLVAVLFYRWKKK